MKSLIKVNQFKVVIAEDKAVIVLHSSLIYIYIYIYYIYIYIQYKIPRNKTQNQFQELLL